MKRLNLTLKFATLLGVTSLTLPAGAVITNLWNVASPGANNWNVGANWTPAGPPGSADYAFFGSVGTAANATTVNNVVSVNTTITGLYYTNLTSGTWHVTQIPDGVKLSTTGNVIVGGGGANSQTTSVAMTGGGTFQATGNNLIIGNQGTSSLDSGTILDLSALSNFVYIASSGTIGMGISNRSTASLTLAALSNFVTAGTINLDTGSSSSSGTAGTLGFGAGTNIINVNTVNIGANRTAGNAAFAVSTGGLRMRGTGGTDADRVTTVVLGNRNTGSSTPGQTTGTFSLGGHPVDIKLGTLTLGQNSQTANTNLSGIGVFSFDQGTVDVTTINMGVCGGNSSTLFFTNGAIGTMTVGASGTLLVNSISLGNVTSTSPGSFANGTLNVNGGTAVCTNNLVKTTTGLTTGIVAVATGSLTVQGRIGSPSNPIDSFNLTNATLHLNVDASGAIGTNAAVATLNAGGTTTITIDNVVGVLGPTTFPLISYSTLNGTVAGNFTYSVPAGYIAALVDNSAQKRIDLSISPSVIIPQLLWTGATNGDWDASTTNWTQGGALATYNDGDIVIFDDTAATSTINLTSAFFPDAMVMSNSVATYTFTGTGAIAGTNTLTLRGSQATILDNTGSNSFTGVIGISGGILQVGNNDAQGNLPSGVVVNDGAALVYKRTDVVTNDSLIGGVGSLTQAGSGTLVLVGANSYGATTISAGALQIGAGGPGGTLGTGAVTDNGSLVFNRSSDLTVANVIGGTGSVTKNNNDTLTLSGASTFSGGLIANGGTVRLGNLAAAGRGTITVNSGGTVVLSALHSNSIVLAGGTLGTSASSLSLYTNDLTAAPGTASTLYIADPQNLTPTDANELAFSNTVHGSGSILVLTVTNDVSPDSGNGLRFRGITASDFSGTIILSNNVKGELQTTVAGPFSPTGTGKFILFCGAFNATNNQNGPTTGGYSEFNLRNNSSGDTTFGNDVALAGTGATFLDPLGTAPAGTQITMGKLTIGGGQELGVYLSAAPAHVVVFPTVSLSGGEARFSPKTPTFGATSSAGSDLELGNITETAPSGIIMAGVSNLFLTGSSANVYSGPTTNLSGTLMLHKTSGDAIPGYLAIPGGTVSLAASDQIADAATVNVSGGTLALGAFNDTVGPVILAGGAITGTGGTLTGANYDVQSGSVSAILAGTAALTKTTTNTVILTAANTYSGITTVSNGTLLVHGLVGTNDVNVVAGTLGGSGAISGNLTVGPDGTLAPGASIGTLTLSNSPVLNGLVLMEINRSATPKSDNLTVGAPLTYGGNLTVTNIGGALQATDAFTLFTATSFSGGFGTVTLPSLSTGLAWDTSKLLVDGSISVAQKPTASVSPATTNAECGSSVVLTANASGTGTLSYQWYDILSNSIPSETLPTLTLANVHAAQAGAYTVVVTNLFGAASASASLTVVDTTAPIISQCASNRTLTADSGGNATLANLTSEIVANDACSGSLHIAQQPIAGSSLPIGTNTVLFAVDDGNGNTNTCSATVVVVSGSVAGQPQITSIKVAAGIVTLSGTNVPESSGHTYYLMTSGDVSTPRTNWLPLVTNTFAADGGFTNSVSEGGTSQFYLIQVPLP